MTEKKQMNELHSDDKILEELQAPHVKRWYTRWWGILLVLIFSLIILIGAWFLSRVQYFVDAINVGDRSALTGVFIDASEYRAGASQVSRTEVESLDDPYWGPIDAKLVIVEFADFGCPFCKQNHPTLVKLRKEYSDRVKFIYRDFPITYVHPEALIAAQAGECADDQGLFWEMETLLFNKQGTYTTEEELVGFADDLGLDVTKFEDCLTNGKYEAEVRNDFQEGIRFGVQGTPTFFINGVKLSGVVSYNTFNELIKRFLERL